MTGTVRNYEPLVLGSVLLLAGTFLTVETFTSPVAGTVVACPPSATRWELFGVSLPVYQFTRLDLLRMQVGWFDGCNSFTGSIWLLVIGWLILMAGGWLVGREVSGHRA